MEGALRAALPRARAGAGVLLIRVLHLDDDRDDHDLVRRALDQAGLDCETRWSPDRWDFAKRLGAERFDLVIADWCLPAYDAGAVMAEVRRRPPPPPVLFVSGMMAPEAPVEARRLGAAGYLLKWELGRLGEAVRAALGSGRP